MNISNIERLPYQSEPPFDCISDHANCAACKAHGEGQHGRSGGAATFGLRGILADGRRIAIVLRVLLGNYTSPVPDSLRQPRGGYLDLHIESADPRCVDCTYVGGRCYADPGSFTCLGADEIYRKFGNSTGDDNQSEAFWRELEDWLRVWAGRVPAIS